MQKLYHQICQKDYVHQNDGWTYDMPTNDQRVIDKRLLNKFTNIYDKKAIFNELYLLHHSIKFKYNGLSHLIIKNFDEYYYVMIVRKGVNIYYKCDDIDGINEFINDYIENNLGYIIYNL